MNIFYKIKFSIKQQKTPLTRLLYALVIKWRFFSFPAPKIIFTPILFIHLFILNTIRRFLIFFYWQPLFEQYLDKKPKHLRLIRSLPYVLGNPLIHIDEYCTINGTMVIIARTSQLSQPKLLIGNRVFIGFNTQFYIGNEISIGDDCKIAEDCILRGYSGHPLDPDARKANVADNENSMGPIILENNVWLGQGVKINPGVCIGENSIIASGSIVTKNIPANVLAAGIPAKVIRKL
jgi:acetyltransferase-like isoleucine patch superfamily enzyme